MEKWRKFNGERIGIPIEEAVEQVISQETTQGFRLKVCIGTDSQVRNSLAEFATVIVFLREKSGGFMYICNDRMPKKMTLKERLLAEVSKSVEIAYRLCPVLDRYHVDLEVHADINTNPKFKSSTTLHEAMGYILAMGFAFKVKPDAFASTQCANRVV